MRCNLLPVKFLTDQHLIAEKRELRMIPPLLEKKLKTRDLQSVLKDIPSSYCLGKGHMNWCLDKSLYLEKRFTAITNEMKKRNFNPNSKFKFNIEPFLKFEKELYLDYKPTEVDLIIIKQRIYERIMEKPNWYKWYSKPVSLEWVETTYK